MGVHPHISYNLPLEFYLTVPKQHAEASEDFYIPVRKEWVVKDITERKESN